MTIQYNKKIQDIILLCASALCMLLFSYSYLGLLVAFACLCGIMITEPWYKNRTAKIDNWCAKHKIFTIIYSCVFGLILFSIGFEGIDSSYVVNILLSIFNLIILVAIVGIGLLKKQSFLPRLLTYVFILFLICAALWQGVQNEMISLLVILSLAGITIFFKNKKITQ